MAFVTLNSGFDLRNARLQLGTEEILLPMECNSDWLAIRVAIRFTALVNVPGPLIGAQLRLGVCVGQNGYSSANTAGYVGMSHLQGTSISAPGLYWNAGWTANIPGYWHSNSLTVGWKVNTSTYEYQVTAAGPYSAMYRWPVRGAWMMDVTKPYNYFNAAAGLAWRARSIATASANTDLTYTNFVAAARNWDTPGTTFNNSSVSAMTTYPGPLDFDTISISWNRALPVVEVSDILLYRIA